MDFMNDKNDIQRSSNDSSQAARRSAGAVFSRIGKYIGITLKWVLIIGVICGLFVFGAGFGYVSALVKDDPVRSKDTIQSMVRDNSLTGFVYFNDGTRVGQLRAEEDRRMAEKSEIPQALIDAVIATEDQNFKEHMGVDLRGTVRAVYQKVMNLDVQTGGSTITQQLARRVFLTLDREDSRKAKEILLALRMERLLSKDEILLAYLNKIPYGNGSSGYGLYGIKAAAKGIFNIDDLQKLNIAQSAYLAGLPQQPSNYSAFTSRGTFDGVAFGRAKERQELVLKRMLEESKITKEQYDEAVAFDLKSSLAETTQKAYNTYPFLMMEVEKEAAKALLASSGMQVNPSADPAGYQEAIQTMLLEMTRGGYHIYTTIDKQIYDQMRAIAENKDNFTPDHETKGMEQIGAIMLDSKTSAILGMIEGRDFNKEQMNHATQAYRQPGSTMKPIAAFLPAMEMGAIQPASVIDDIPVILEDGQYGHFIPENWDDGYHGLVSARTAFNQSYNIPAIRLFNETVGIENAWNFARRMGIVSVTEKEYIAKTGVIGGLNGVTVKEMTNAYATISNYGAFNEAYMIEKITDSNGKVIYQHQVKPSAAFSEETAYLMTDMLRTVITSGTAKDLMSKFKHYGKIPIVGKTGSTQDDADAWFIGYSPDITVGVWAGYEMPVHKLSSAGKQRAKNIWALVMNAAVETKPELFKTKEFVRPANVVELTVSSLSGKLPSEETNKAGKLTTDLFNKKFLPAEEDDVMVKLPIIPYKGMNYIAKPTTPSDFVTEKVVIRRGTSLNALFKRLEEIIPTLPKERQRSLSFYRPHDYSSDAPSENDPRTDDGKPPKAPAITAATNGGGASVITFQASSEEDVIGYRLYKSVNKGLFELVKGKVIYAGDETKFTDTSAPTGRLYGYYVAAVDVSGKESDPSRAAYTDGTFADLMFMLPEVFSEESSEELSSSDNEEQNSQEPAVDTVPSAPAGIKLKASNAALTISWKANPKNQQITEYQVFYSEKENGPYTKIGTIKKNTEFRYYAGEYKGYYRVTAVNRIGESAPSESVQYK